MPSREQSRSSAFSCSSPNCTGLLLGSVASVLVIGGIFLAFHNWDYNWLLVSGIGSLLVLIAAAVPFCSRESGRPVHGKRGNGSLHMANSETLPSAPPLSATYSVSQLSLNILPPLYPGCDELPPSPPNSPPNGVPVNHIMNINGQSYLLLPIVSPTTQTNTSTTTEAQNPCYSAALSCLQVELPTKQESERQNERNTAVDANAVSEMPVTNSLTQRDLLCESPPAEDTTSPLPTSPLPTSVSNAPTIQVFDAIPLTTPTAECREPGTPAVMRSSEMANCNSNRASRTNSVSERTTVELPDDLLSASETDVAISDQLPLIVIDPENSETVLENAHDDSAASTNASQAENDTDFLLTVGADASDVDDDDRLVGATPPPSYDEVASERNPNAFESSFGTL
ncbi:hypothetical protein MTO96_004374 [Rhipicephalus appendiculatus]|uniref:Pancreatic trypsin inhibitor-Lipocalin n=1 Tax=Rhipicephalus appendiculatus TaxID=34631 RepID=A0A131YQ56_RHIAP